MYNPLFSSEFDLNFVTQISSSSFQKQVHEDLRVEDDDNDGSGSGFGDDEDDDRRGGSHIIKPDQTLNTHHSGDGSDHSVDNENTDDDDGEEYPENHEDHTPIHTDDIYFDNNKPTDKTISTPTTDDEDSQLIFIFILFFYLHTIII